MTRDVPGAYDANTIAVCEAVMLLLHLLLLLYCCQQRAITKLKETFQ